ncbi:hypothetical protein AMR42_04655 [Limnothrix sp. PR1529]|uniref:DUF2232 domain-containing protein n=1 Tax=Limnothrix sp. PR1529 TaxID=1704291 RepID=UPI00081D6359|nr:DUF2232 domain-containing protein [Limnothrix sp. PR1529]OCQ95126.1 hypothetical protein BCR12_06955 [Limnothrix sp. P13C2]PIB14705.1 hypothetical protein AMR42_04655 [Limnothrix sp. PR1529]
MTVSPPRSPADLPPEPENRPLQPPRTDTIAPLALVETAFLASAASLIWLVNFYFPLGPALRVFFSLPIALVYLRWGSRSAWMAAIVSGLLLSVLMGPPRSIQYVMPYGLLGVLLGCLWRRGVGWGRSIALGTLLSATGLFFRIALVSTLLGDDLWTYVTVQVTGLLEWGATRLSLLWRPELGAVQGATVLMILVNAAVYVFAVHLVSWAVFERLGLRLPPPPRWVQTLLEID